MGALFGGGQRAAPVAPPPPPAPIPPPKNITVGTTPINRAKQRRQSSLANAQGQNRSLLNDDIKPLGVV